MKFEDILEEVGSFGIYQKLLCFILIPVTTGLCALTYYSQIFILTAPNHFCKQTLPENLNVTSNMYNQSLNTSENHFLTDKMLHDEFTCYQFSKEELDILLDDGNSTLSLEPRQKCTNGWEYNYETLFPTVTSQNNWVCEEAWKPYLIVSCFWVGNTIGAWIFGALGDILGRRPAIALSFLMYGTAGAISAFTANYFYAFLILRFLVGSAHHTITHLPFVLVVEYCGIKSRVIPLLTIMMTYTIGSILAPLLALAVWDWKSLTLATSVPALFMLVFYRWLPESPSWMMTKGKVVPAINQLEKVSKINKTSKSREHLLQKVSSINTKLPNSNEEQSVNSNPPLSRLLKFPRLRRNVFTVLLVWMISCLCFYGHCQNTANLGSDIFKSYLLGATIEIPSWSVPYLIQKFGRKPTLVVAFLLSGISGIIYASLPSYLENVILGFALLGRLFITGAYYITLQYGPEIFPTVIRGRGVAMSETLGGIAIFVSPLVVYLGEFHSTLPLIIFSILSIFGGLTTLLLPETKGRALPQTLSQAEMFAKNTAPHQFRFKSRKGEVTKVNDTPEDPSTRN